MRFGQTTERSLNAERLAASLSVMANCAFRGETYGSGLTEDVCPAPRPETAGQA